MATFWVEAGHGGTDSGTEANPWLTIMQAVNNPLAAADIVNVKNGTDYTEVVVIANAGTATSPITFRGHGGTPGDGGMVVINGGGGARANGFDLQTNAVPWFNIIENFTCHGHGTDGFGGGATWDTVLFVNCKAHSNTGWGFQGDNWVKHLRCESYSNSTGGFKYDLDPVFVGCVSRDNTGIGIQSKGRPVIVGTLVYNNEGGAATSQVKFTTSGLPVYVINSTVDGDAASATQTIIGIEFSGAADSNWNVVFVDAIINDCDTGVSAANDAGPGIVVANNMYDDCTTAKRLNFDAGYDGIDDPTTPGINADFSLASGSEAKAAGIDAAEVKNGASYMDIGGLQRQEGGVGGGGLLMPNKRGGKQ